MRMYVFGWRNFSYEQHYTVVLASTETEADEIMLDQVESEHGYKPTEWTLLKWLPVAPGIFYDICACE